MTKTEQKHTPGPLRVDPEWESDIQTVNGEEVATTFNVNDEGAEMRIQGPIHWFPAQQKANACLLAASYNAFDSAATRLNLIAVELAERMQDGGIADLIAALKLARSCMADCDVHTAMPEQAAQIDAALAKVGVL